MITVTSLLVLLTYVCKFSFASSDQAVSSVSSSNDAGSCNSMQFVLSFTMKDGSDDFVVYWSIDKTEITFKVIAKTQGFIGFGIANYDTLDGSDVIVGGFKNGKGYLTDRHVEDGMAVVDQHQDWFLVDACQDKSQTTLIFNRKINTCDKQDRPITDDTLRIISFWNKDDLQDNGQAVSIRSNLIARSGDLLQTIPNYSVSKLGLKAWTVQSPNKLIPKKTTTYWCNMRKMPTLGGKKHHVIMIEPYFEPKESKSIIHHSLVFVCFNLSQSEIDKYLDKEGFECGEDPAFLKCTGSRYSAFGRGTERFSFPEQVGVPIGGKEDVYVFLQIHYNNEQHITGIHDRSGIRHWYTDKLRKYDAGLFSAANMLWGMELPPRQPRYLVNGHCSSDCTSHILPRSGIYIFNAILHTHTYGRAVRMRHFRKNVELPYISSDEHFDWSYQIFRTFPEPVLVLPGDQMTAECFYSTLDSNVTILGGNPSSKEMCIIYMYFYPFNGYPLCRSAPIGDLLTGLLGVGTSSSEQVTYPEYLTSMSFSKYAKTFDWINQTYIRAAELITTIGPHNQFCQLNNITMRELNTRYPENYTPYTKPSPEDSC